MLADGGDCLADLSALRDQSTLLGDVPSAATAWGARAALDREWLAAVRRARAKARGRAWKLAGAPRRVILDLGAAVAELSLDLSTWPTGTRAICRRERPHPGVQLSFSDDNGYRFQVFITNQHGKRIERVEQLHRHHAVVEDRIRCGKDTGLRNLPFRRFEPNAERSLTELLNDSG